MLYIFSSHEWSDAPDSYSCEVYRVSFTRINFKNLQEVEQIGMANGKKHLLSVLVVLVLPLLAASLSFNFTSFDPNNIDVHVEGDASVSDRLIQLTSNRGDKSKAESVGRAVYPQPLPIWNEDSGEVTDFTTHFSFVVNAQNLSPYGDGFTFFLAHVDLPLPVSRGGGRGLGLLSTEQVLNPTTSPSAYPFVAVEFDTFANIVIDPDYEHVGIDIKSMNSSAYVKWCSNAMKGQENEAWIAYDSSSKNLSISFYGFCNDTKVRQLVSYRVDLSTILPTFVMFGFSGATGNYSEIHTIKSWSFSSTLTFGHAPEGEKIGKRLKVGFIAVGFTCVLIAVLGSVWCVLIKKRKKEEDAFDLVMDDEFERGTGPKRFLYDDLARATSDFAEGEKLGEGGFGSVYKGYLKDLESHIAVKRVSKGSNQGIKEYASEVRIISCLRHKNLVQLIGWCHEKRGLLLVYEFMPNGSLDYHLFKEKSELSWIQRSKIVQGLTSALYYLHEEWEQCVVHRDIKSSNIMLDASFTAKLGDFGLARLVDHAKGSHTTILAGTLGYMAPECYVTGKASKESDVYSFGVVALEIACGRRPFNPNAEERERVLVHWVWELHGSGNILEAADPRLCGDFDEEQMKQLLMVGIWCTHPDNGFRPSIRQAIQALNGEAPLPILPSKMPVPTYSSILEPLPDQSSGRHIFSTMVPR